MAGKKRSREERKILASKVPELRAMGRSRKEIAQELGVPKGTVDWYWSPGRTELYRSRRRKNPERRCRSYGSLEERRIWERLYYRNNQLTTYINNKSVIIKVKKRPWTGVCELCRRARFTEENKEGYNGQLDWHHWDDNNPGLGMWLCHVCHQFAGGIEHGLKVNDYLKLKDAIIHNE